MATTIIKGRWYRFDSEKSKFKWLQLVMGSEKYQNKDERYSLPFFMEKELLCFSENNTICYRTKDDKRYDGANAITFGMEDTTNNIVQKENIMINNLINKAKKEAVAVLNKEIMNAQEVFYKNTGIWKFFFENYGEEKALELCEDAKIKRHFLTEVEKEALDTIFANHITKQKEIESKYNELSALISIADTYEQKEDLLFRYGIIGTK